MKFAGSYTHSAYGMIHVADVGHSMLASLEANTANEDVGPELTRPATLHVRPSKRTWPNKYAPRQTSPLELHMHVFFGRGSDDTPANELGDNLKGTGSLTYKNIKVLEYLYTRKAIFEENEQGLVSRLGNGDES